jgi:hypothetical protein
MTKTMRKMIMTLPVGFVMKRALWGLLLVLALVSFTYSEAKAKTIQVNDGKIEAIYYDSDVLVIKLTAQALNYGWTSSGANDLARDVIYLVERDGKACQNVKISKLARQIQLHCAAYSGPTGGRIFPGSGTIKKHANPVNVTWRELR